MSFTIPNTTTTANYKDATFAGNDVFASGFFTIANNSAFIRLLHGIYGQSQPGPEIFLPPGTYPILGTRIDPISGIQFKDATSLHAQVFGTIYYPNESSILSGNQFNSIVSPSGSVTPQPGSVITYTSVFPTTSADGDLVAWTPNQALYPGVVWFMRFNATSGFWEILGGNPIVRSQQAGNTNGATLGTWLNMVGTTITVPRTGQYYCWASGRLTAGGGGAMTMSTAIYLNTPANIFPLFGSDSEPAGYNTSFEVPEFRAGVTIGDSIGVSGQSNAANAVWDQFTWGIMPIEIS